MEEQKYVLFKIGSEEYGIDIQEVISIEKMQSITALPKTPNYITGITTIRGNVTPVFDLRIALGKENTGISDSTRMIVIHLEGKPVGLVVDAATDVIDIPHATIQDPMLAGMEEQNLLKGISKLASRLIILLDIEHLLKDLNVLKTLKELQVA